MKRDLVNMALGFAGAKDGIDGGRTGQCKAETSGESIYHILAKHQREEQWNQRDMVALLQDWAEVMNAQFNLRVPRLVLCVDRLPVKIFGHFRTGFNGFALEGEVAINSRYLPPARPLWEVLGTLLHEMVHAWQAVHGRPTNRWHHNVEFRAKARELGLVVDSKGFTGYAANSPFKDMLRRLGVDVPDGEIAAPKEKPRGESKLKKWTCGCGTAVRVAIEDFRARCLTCDSEFVRDNVRSGSAETAAVYAIKEPG